MQIILLRRSSHRRQPPPGVDKSWRGSCVGQCAKLRACDNESEPSASGRALSETHFVERFRDPRSLVLMRLQSASLEQRIGILVPVRLREIMP